MNAISKWLMALTLLSSAAYGQVPSTNDTSDAHQNTGMGSVALNHTSTDTSGANNTAAGYAALYFNTTGSANTAIGTQALFSNTDGSFNTASGYYALVFNTASYNTATGGFALGANTTGSNNVATGYGALSHNETGSDNTASGYSALASNTGNRNNAAGTNALYSNTTASDNNAMGDNALYSNITGTYNNAMGGYSLYYNTTGSQNNAMGYGAMYQNTTGSNNSAQGRYALANNTTGNGNSVVGAGALKSNTTGSNNTAAGIAAMVNNTSGSGNVAIGDSAGANLTTGSNNIDILNSGVAGESGIIRIGEPNVQTATYIGGIENAKITGSAVYVTSSGQLGVLASSERYKTAIATMNASNTEKLKQLRPVSFHLKSDPNGTIQYGLIAEEVNKVYPELVIRDDAGKIQGVRYDELAPMLLNEIQKQQRINSAQAAKIRELKGQVAELNDLKQEMRAALLKLQSKDKLVAQR